MSQEQQNLTHETQELEIPVNGIDSQSAEPVQMVPVSEAIRYRKRAQAAEQQVQSLSEQVEKHQQACLEAQSRLAQSQRDNTLTQELMQAGVTDGQVALLLLKEQLANSQDEPNIKEIIQRMQQQRPYLFGGLADNSTGDGSVSFAKPTASVRTPDKAQASSLARTAQQAQRSGSRKDMQEYLRMRRSTL